MKQHKIFEDQLIVITGAAGFIGSGVVRYLNDRGMSNLLLVDDIQHTDKWKNLVGKKFVDLISKHTLFNWLVDRESEVEAFIHLGACSSTTEEDGDFLLDNNYRYSIKLAEYAMKHDHRFIYASSAATYGDGSNGFSDDENALEELRPLNMYGYSKHLFDLWCKRENLLNKVVGLKYFNVFGPNEYHKGIMASMIYHMMHKVKKEGVIRLFKSNTPDFQDGDQVRDFIYVKDAVRMTCQLLDDAFRDIAGIFNIGRGKTETWNSMAKYLFSAMNKPEKIEYFDMPKSLLSQYQNYTCANMSKYNKVHKISGNVPETMTMDVAVKEYTQEYLLRNARW